MLNRAAQTEDSFMVKNIFLLLLTEKSRSGMGGEALPYTSILEKPSTVYLDKNYSRQAEKGRCARASPRRFNIHVFKC